MGTYHTHGDRSPEFDDHQFSEDADIPYADEAHQKIGRDEYAMYLGTYDDRVFKYTPSTCITVEVNAKMCIDVRLIF